jgi:hypothetical protein
MTDEKPKLADFTLRRLRKVLARRYGLEAIDLEDLAIEVLGGRQAVESRSDDVQFLAVVEGAKDLLAVAAAYPELDADQIEAVLSEALVLEHMQDRYRLVRDNREVLVRCDCLTPTEHASIVEELQRQAQEAYDKAEALRRYVLERQGKRKD